jgi:hypothetical protein
MMSSRRTRTLGAHAVEEREAKRRPDTQLVLVDKLLFHTKLEKKQREREQYFFSGGEGLRGGGLVHQ